MSEKLYGYIFSPSVQEVLHVIELTGAKVTVENVPWENLEESKKLLPKTQTTTLPFLETKEGTIAQSKAIDYYLVEKYKPEMLGKKEFERAQVRQWIEFADEFNQCAQELYYPILGWRTFDHERHEKAQKRVENFFRALDQQVKGKKYIMGDHITLADPILFRAIKLYFQLVFPEGLRKNICPNVNDWFLRIFNTPECDKVYGKFHLCKAPLKAQEKKEDKKHEKQEKHEKHEKQEKKKEKKPEKKEEKEEEEEPKPKKKKNPLDELPPSSLVLEDFKRKFINNPDKKAAMEDFWKEYDPKGYCFYWIQYQNLPTDCKVLFLTCNNKNYFLQKADPVKRYVFGVHGIYGVEGDYKIRGVWMFRGNEIPELMNENESFEWYDKVRLDPSKPEDKQKINDYWTLVNTGDVCDGRAVADVDYVH